MKVLGNVLFKNWYLFGAKKIASHAHRTGSWYLLGIFFKISEEHPRPFYMGGPLRDLKWAAALVKPPSESNKTGP